MTTSWQFSQSTPAIPLGRLHGDLDAKRAGAAHVIRLGDRLRMVYWGTGADGAHRILAADAPIEKPNDWSPLGELIGPQRETQYNCHGPSFPWVVPVDEKRWLLYFCGWGSFPGRRLPNSTGVAVSDDGGRTWRYPYEQPILPFDRRFDAEATGSVAVIREHGKFRMWYTAIGRYFDRPPTANTGHGDRIPEIGIAYAESDDGLTWTKPIDHLVVQPRHFGVEPFEYIVSKPMVLVNPNPTAERRRYTLWVNTFGHAYRVHRLSSDDGLRWDWLPRTGPEGELGIGEKGAFDDQQRSYPTMLELGDSLHCWFTGNGFGTAGMGHAVMRIF